MTMVACVGMSVGATTWDYYIFGCRHDDSDGNGIGDTHYDIMRGVSIDRLPPMQPWTDTPSQKGDLNGNDQITPADTAIALAFATGGSASCDPATLTTANVSDDNRVTSLDMLMILQAAADAIDL